MKLWFLPLLLLPLAAIANADERVLLVLGDSLSAAFGIDPRSGWVNLLQQRLDTIGGGWRVINAGISGDTSAGGLARLPRLLTRHQPQLVVIELGSNDGLRNLDFTALKENLRQLILLSQAAGADVLLVGARVPPNYGEAYAAEFHQIFHSVAAATNVPLLPFLLAGVAQDRNLMQADGYHPNATAQPQLLENLWPQLQPLIIKASVLTITPKHEPVTEIPQHAKE